MKRIPTPATDYPAGFFLALVREHNWPPNFEPRFDIPDTEYKRRMAGQAASEVAITTGAGWNTGTIVLPNTPTWRRPEMMKARAA